MENENDLSDYRKVYQKSALDINNVPEDPITLFQRWFSRWRRVVLWMK